MTLPTWKLKTEDLLLKWGINVDAMCVFCRTQPETREHLFFECKVTCNF